MDENGVSELEAGLTKEVSVNVELETACMDV